MIEQRPLTPDIESFIQTAPPYIRSILKAVFREHAELREAVASQPERPADRLFRRLNEGEHKYCGQSAHCELAKQIDEAIVEVREKG